jgi:hypothetical protein
MISDRHSTTVWWNGSNLLVSHLKFLTPYNSILSSSSEANNRSASLQLSVFYGAKNVLLSSRKPATGYWSEPDDTSPRCYTLFLIILPSMSTSPKWSLPFKFFDLIFYAYRPLIASTFYFPTFRNADIDSVNLEDRSKKNIILCCMMRNILNCGFSIIFWRSIWHKNAGS